MRLRERTRWWKAGLTAAGVAGVALVLAVQSRRTGPAQDEAVGSPSKPPRSLPPAGSGASDPGDGRDAARRLSSGDGGQSVQGEGEADSQAPVEASASIEGSGREMHLPMLTKQPKPPSDPEPDPDDDPPGRIFKKVKTVYGRPGGDSQAPPPQQQQKFRRLPSFVAMTEPTQSLGGQLQGARIHNEAFIQGRPMAWADPTKGPEQGKGMGEDKPAPQGQPCVECPNALDSKAGRRYDPKRLEIVGTIEPMGLCDGYYLYKLTNRSSQPIGNFIIQNTGETWGTNLPAGGAEVIRSKEPIPHRAIGRILE